MKTGREGLGFRQLLDDLCVPALPENSGQASDTVVSLSRMGDQEPSLDRIRGVRTRATLEAGGCKLPEVPRSERPPDVLTP